MTAQDIDFELVSPEEKLISEPVRMAVIPGDEGEFGVMAGHAALVASLQPGVVTLFAGADGDSSRRIFISGGFADVTGGLCTILAEAAVNVDDLDQGDLEKELADLSEDLGLAEEVLDKARIEQKISLVKAKLSAVSGQLVV